MGLVSPAFVEAAVHHFHRTRGIADYWLRGSVQVYLRLSTTTVSHPHGSVAGGCRFDERHNHPRL